MNYIICLKIMHPYVNVWLPGPLSLSNFVRVGPVKKYRKSVVTWIRVGATTSSDMTSSYKFVVSNHKLTQTWHWYFGLQIGTKYQVNKIKPAISQWTGSPLCQLACNTGALLLLLSRPSLCCKQTFLHHKKIMNKESKFIDFQGRT